MPSKSSLTTCNFLFLLAFYTTIIPVIYASTKGNIIKNDPFRTLSSILSPRIAALYDPTSGAVPTHEDQKKVLSSVKQLSKSQSALKKLDGAAYEAYQRTHSGASSDSSTTSVSGRASRSAQRIACTAEALFACELCELLEATDDEDDSCDESSVSLIEEYLSHSASSGDRSILLNVTHIAMDDAVNCPPLKVMCLYEPDYRGDAGISHGGIHSLGSSSSVGGDKDRSRGRLLVIIGDEYGQNFVETMRCLDSEACSFQVTAGLVAETGSVHEGLWKGAAKVLDVIREALLSGVDIKMNATKTTDDGFSDAEKGGEMISSQGKNVFNLDLEHSPVIHFVGRSLAGGVASLASCILDGSLPFPMSKRARTRKRKSSKSLSRNTTAASEEDTIISSNNGSLKSINDFLPASSLCGFGRGRTSAFVLGPPPVLSANIRAAFVTSLIHGDDLICRTSKDSIDRLCDRLRSVMKRGVLTKKIGWMSDTFSLTVSH